MSTETPGGPLLVEALCRLESRGITVPASADEAGRVAGGDLLTRLEARAEASGHAETLGAALTHVSRSVRFVLILIALFALIAGAAAARTVLAVTPGHASGHAVNILAVITGLLLIQLLLLAVWIAVLLLRGRGTLLSPLAALARSAGAAVALRLGRSTPAPHAAAVEAHATRLASPSFGRWGLSAVSHLAWSAFNIGAIAALLVLLSTREVHFNWETTILPRPVAVGAARAVAAVPGAVGFTVPDDATIERSEADVDPELARSSRGAWSGLLIGAVVCYGLAPRLVLSATCLLLAGRARRRWSPDFDRPEYVGIARRLMPDAGPSRIVTSAAVPAGPGDLPRMNAPGTGPPVVLGFEIEPPSGPWPPPLHGVRWLDLGFIESREDRHRALDELTGLAEPAVLILIVCDLRATPDRGLSAFLAKVADRHQGPLHLLLTGGQALRDRSGAAMAAERIAVWRTYADELGLGEHHGELDIDHLTADGRRRLAELLGLETAVNGSQRAPTGLTGALRLIADAAGEWTSAPDLAAQSALQQSIAECFGAESPRWRTLLGLPDQLNLKDLSEAAVTGGRNMLDLLPAGLRRHPRWMAAGAVAGAAGCGAAALLLSPVAIGSLPLWSALGAAVAAAFTPTGSARTTSSVDGSDIGEALQAAALFALLLELQGCDEITIGARLERTLTDLPEPVVVAGDRSAARAWLTELRHRFDCAEAGAAGGES